MVAASWAAARRAWNFYLACEIRLQDGEVYVYDSFTRPDLRGQAVSPAIRAEMVRYFRAAGYRRMILGTVPENASNLQVARKTGFHPVGVIGYVKIGPWRWDFYRTNKNRER
jgi:L-amino acid N-acyltransferase YncA